MSREVIVTIETSYGPVKAQMLTMSRNSTPTRSMEIGVVYYSNETKIKLKCNTDGFMLSDNVMLFDDVYKITDICKEEGTIEIYTRSGRIEISD